MSRKIVRSILALSMVLFLGLVLAVPMVSATGAQAPTWTKGDAWAMGKSVDLDVEFAQQLDELQQNLEDSLASSNAQVNEFDVQAMASAYIVLKVADVTGTEVVLQGKVGGKFTGDASISITAEMPVAGTYGIMETPTKASKTISADIGVDLAAVIEVDVVLEKATSSVKSVEAGVKASAALSAKVVNFPETEYNWTLNQVTYSYKNYDVSLDFNFFVTLKAEFTPALDLFNFPLELGDNWTVDSDAVITGTYGGSLDIKGLPQEIEDQLFDSQTMKDLGIESFPVDFATVIDNPEKPYMHDGIIGPETVNMDPVDLECIAVESVMIGDWSVTKYTIQLDSGESEYYYYDSDKSFLKEMSQVMKDVLENEVDIPVEIPVDDPALNMEDMTVSTAEQKIDEISDYRAQIAGESEGSGMAEMDLMVALLIVAVVAVAAVLLVFVMLKRPKVK